MKKIILFLLCLFLLINTIALSESDFFKEFKKNYDYLDVDLLNYEAEVFTVTDFVYKKDIGTFTFEEGKIYLARYINDRPTTAIFYGKGHAQIDIPSSAERNALKSISKKENIDEDFKIAIMRLGDDFDLKLNEHSQGEIQKIKWKYYAPLKDEQADFYFKPVLYHIYDNNFQQIRSIYERNADGFFWIDFNRYNFMYDPNRPEEVIIAYEFEIKDFAITDAVNLQKVSKNNYVNEKLSDFTYPTTSISKIGKIEMGGMDGTKLLRAESEMKLVINADSLKFITTFLHFHLKLDSITYEGKSIDYYRRREFNFIGLILPEYKYKGDTLSLTYWYHGKDFDYVMPYVKDPTPCLHNFTFTIPKGYNYIMPGMGELTDAKKNKVSFNVNPETPFTVFKFQGYASGFDTVSIASDMGMPLNFIKGKHIRKSIDCFVKDEIYEKSVMDAFNFMSKRVGPPIGTESMYVFPENFLSMPGMVEVPQILCYESGDFSALGGFNLFSGYSMARQWFGYSTKPATEREKWFKPASSLYLSFMSVQHNVSSGAYFSNLLNRRDSILTNREVNRDRPVFIGDRAEDDIFTNRGVWLFHMLRYMMYDLEKNSESNFNRFIYELAVKTNEKQFKNEDVIALAEKYYKDDLDWFFNQWLYNCSYPEYKVVYTIIKEGAEYFVTGTVETSKVAPDFKMPIIMRVKGKDKNTALLRETIVGAKHDFKFGPYSFEPEELIFNELYSVLSKDKVKKIK